MNNKNLSHQEQAKPETIEKLREDLAALCEIEARYRTLFSASPNALFLIGANGYFLDANQAALDWYGYSLTEFKQMTPADLAASANLSSQALNKVQHALQEPTRFECRHRCKDGRELPVEINTTPVKVGDQICTFANIQDLTERKRAEEALREAERRLSEAQKLAQLGYWVWDVKTGNVEWSEEVFNIFHLDPKEFTPQIDSILALSPWPEDHERDKELIRKAMETHEKGTYEQRFLRPDQNIGYYHSTFQGKYDNGGNLIFIVGTVLDITERKRAEAALRESEDKFKYVFDHLPIGESITLPSGEISVNQALCEMLGYCQDELKNRKWQEITHPDDVELTQKAVNSLLSGEKEAARFMKRYLHKNGSVVWTELSTSLRRDKDGQPLYFMTSVNDITTRKQAEAALRESIISLDRSQRVGKLGNWDWDVAGNTLVWSDELYRIWGVGKDFTLTFDSISGMIHPDDQGLNAKNVQALLDAGEQGEFEFRLICPDGTVKYIFQNIEVARGLSGEPIRLFGIMQDITARKQAEEANNKHNQLLLALHNIDLEIGAELRLPVLLDRILEHAQALLIADRGGGIYLYEPGENVLRLAQGSGINQGRNGITVGMGQGVAGHVFQAAQTLVVDDYTHWEERATILVADPPSTVIGVPLLQKGQVIGVLTLIANSHLRKFSAQDVQQAELFATKSAIAIQNAQLYQQAQAEIAERKQAEEILKESEKRFATIFRANPAAIAITQLDTGQLVEVNAAWQEVTGYGRAEAIGHTPLELDMWANPGQRAGLVEMVQQQGRARNEMQLLRKSGEVHDLLMSAEIIELGGKPHFLTMAQDITARKQAEHILTARVRLLQFSGAHSLDELLRATLDELETLTGSQVGFYHFLEADQKTLSLQTWSTRTLREMCITPGSGRHYDIADAGVWVDCVRERRPVIHNDYASLPASRRKGLPAGHAKIIRELVTPVFRGEQIVAILGVGNKPTDYTPSDVEIVANFAELAWDIAERKRMEETLRETSDRLTHMLANSPTVIYALTVDGGQAIPAWISNNIESVMGFSAQAAMQPEWWAGQIHPEDRSAALASLEHLFDDFYQHEYRFLRKDGQVIWLQDEHRLLRAEENQPREIIGAWTDISERKQAEEALKEYNTRLETAVEARTRELREAQEQLVRQEKLALLGQLAGGVGHELRNPLAVINNAAYYLKLVQPEANEKIKQYIGMIEQETHTAEKIINDLLDFARIKSVDQEPVAVPELARRVLERFPAPETVAVTFDLPPDLPKVFVDPRQMEQVLGNLVVNACQAMTSGGKLSVISEQLSVEGVAWVRIAVKDTGVGIPPENMKKLFEPLFTTKAKGIGLGLAISKKLVEANGGRLEVASEVGVGSTFTLYLPVKW